MLPNSVLVKTKEHIKVSCLGRNTSLNIAPPTSAPSFPGSLCDNKPEVVGERSGRYGASAQERRIDTEEEREKALMSESPHTRGLGITGNRVGWGRGCLISSSVLVKR